MDKKKKENIIYGTLFACIFIFLLVLGVSEYRDNRKRKVAEKNRLEEIKQEAFRMEQEMNSEYNAGAWKKVFMNTVEKEVQEIQNSEAEALRGIAEAIEGLDK